MLSLIKTKKSLSALAIVMAVAGCASDPSDDYENGTDYGNSGNEVETDSYEIGYQDAYSDDGSSGKANSGDSSNNDYGEPDAYIGTDSTGNANDILSEIDQTADANPVDNPYSGSAYAGTLVELEKNTESSATPPSDEPKSSYATPPQAIDLKSMSPPPNPFEAVDVVPTPDILSWVGFYFQSKDKKIDIKILTQGHPQFEVFQEQNQSSQPELVVRFLNTRIRSKISRAIDASEFRSPVAYIRMREDNAAATADVVLSLRDPVQPTLYASQGNVMLSFQIPDHYYGLPETNEKPIAKAEPLAAFAIRPILAKGSDRPKTTLAMIYDPTSKATFSDAQSKAPINQVSSDTSNIDPMGLPASYGNLGNSTNSNLATAIGNSSTEESPAGNGYDLNTSSNYNSGINQSYGPLNQNEQQEEQEQQEQEQEQEQEQQQEQNNYGSLDIRHIFAASGLELIQHMSFQGVAQDSFDTYEDVGLNNQYGTGYDEAGLQNENLMGLDNFSNKNIPDNTSTTTPTSADPILEASYENAVQSTEVADIDPTPPGAEGKFAGNAISMDFFKTPLSLVLKAFAEETGNNFIYRDKIGEISVTIHFVNVPWDEALKAILETNGLAMASVGDRVVRVDEVALMTDYMTKLEQAQTTKRRLIPTKVLVMKLNHSKASSVQKSIQDLLANDIVQDNRIKLVSDDRTNSLVAEAPTPILSKIKTLVDRIDLATPQVEIASRLIEVSKNSNDFLGIVWGSRFNFDPGRALGFGNLNFPNSFGSDFSVDPGVIENNAAGNANFRFGSLNRFIDLDLLLKMEEKRGSANVLQSNKVLVLDRQTAQIVSGETRFFRTSTASTIITGQTDNTNAAGNGVPAPITFNLMMKVTPEVTASGMVNMDINISSDTPGETTGSSLAAKSTRSLETKMAKMSGETAVIGGLYDTKKVESEIGVPFFSDLPIIGVLFRSHSSAETLTEFLVMITPKILKSDTDSSPGPDTASAESFGNIKSTLPEANASPANLQPGNALNQYQGQNQYQSGQEQQEQEQQQQQADEEGDSDEY